MDHHDLRAALGQFATGVTVVTTRTSTGSAVGTTVNSFSSVSLDPPLVLWSLSTGASTYRHFAQAERFGISVLADQQQCLASRFSAKHPDRFAGVGFRNGPGGTPLLDGALAHFVCTTRSRHVEGDHVILIGAVEFCQRFSGDPLVFFAGQYQSLATDLA